jgi:phosphoenolpyruvate synthase/pyruvate phosphate dikinase
VKAGIDSISLNPDSVIEVKQRIARIKKKKGK